MTEIKNDDQPTENLGSLVGHGFKWSVVNLVVVRAGTLFSGIVLARILAPEDFGLFAVALVIAAALLEVNDLGIMNALIRSPRPPVSLIPTGMTLTFISSCLLYGLTFTAAPVVASLVHMPDATTLLRVLSLIVIIDGVSAIPAALLTRSFRQDKRAVADVTGLVLNVTITIVLALQGAGAWSFVVGRLVGNVVGGLIVIAFSGVRILPGWDSDVAKSLLHFGLPLAGAGFINFALLNTDYLIVGHSLGGEQLGFYVLAFNLSSFPVNVLTMAIRRVSVAAYGRYSEDRQRLSYMLAESMRLTIAGAGLLACLLIASSAPLVAVVYGTEWSSSAAALSLLAVMGAIRVLANLGQDFLAALGRTRLVLAIQLIWVAVLVPSLVFGAKQDGITGVAMAHAIVAAVVVLPVIAVVLPKAVGMAPGKILQLLIRPVVATIAGVAAGRWAGGRIVAMDVEAPIELCVCLAIATVIYLAIAGQVKQLHIIRMVLSSSPSCRHE